MRKTECRALLPDGDMCCAGSRAGTDDGVLLCAGHREEYLEYGEVLVLPRWWKNQERTMEKTTEAKGITWDEMKRIAASHGSR